MLPPLILWEIRKDKMDILIRCQDCPVSKVCATLERHKIKHRITHSATSWAEPNTIMVDAQGRCIETNYVKCPLYAIVS